MSKAVFALMSQVKIRESNSFTSSNICPQTKLFRLDLHFQVVDFDCLIYDLFYPNKQSMIKYRSQPICFEEDISADHICF